MRFWFGIVLYGMLWIWLTPLPVLTDTAQLWPFLLFLAAAFACELLPVPFWLRGMVKLFSLGAVGYLYYDWPSPPWQPSFWMVQQQLWKEALSAWSAGRWMEVPAEWRTVAFMSALWYVQAMLWHYVVRRNAALWLVILTLLYLAILDTFTPFSAAGPVVLALCLGLLLLSLRRLNSALWLRGRESRPVRWIFAAGLLIGIVASVGWLLPKPGPAWPDPAAWMVHFGNQGAVRGAGFGAMPQKVGYGQNDERLGGPFLQDDSPVLEVETTLQAYWRGETKEVYTGKGWESRLRENRPISGDDEGEQLFLQGVETQTHQQTVRVVGDGISDYPLFFSGELQEAVRVTPSNPLYLFDDYSRVDALGDVRQYELVVQVPLWDLEQLRASGTQEIPEEMQERYLQLPDRLPDRVRQLAEQITREEGSDYDKAQAVEFYLKSPLFTYDTQDVPYPQGEQDFVDQFLFETRVGYCDHFSSAMVVLLRSLEIPARWVKGFTTGDVTLSTESEGIVYEGTVRNSDAHSWVEVYFPQVGWVPFDPTKGFYLPSLYAAAEEELLPEDVEEELLEETETEEATQNLSFPWAPVSVATVWPFLLGLALAASLALWLARDRLWYWLAIHRGPVPSPERLYMQGYQRMLRMLQRKRPMAEGQTLREYIASLPDEAADKKELLFHTEYYERLRYGSPGSVEMDWGQMLRRLWGDLVRKA